jgi:hypothetical protein
LRNATGVAGRFRKLVGRTSRDIVEDPDLCLNLSYVLHERSTSQAVRQCASRCRSNEKRVQRLTEPTGPSVVTGDPTLPHDHVLTAHLGAHAALSRSILAAGGTLAHEIVMIDAPGNDLRSHRFFRATAALRLPSDQPARVMVAALVLRPGGRSTQLAVAGCFDWPDEKALAICAVESLIRSYVDQWSPPRALWADSAEVLLQDEIG